MHSKMSVTILLLAAAGSAVFAVPMNTNVNEGPDPASWRLSNEGPDPSSWGLSLGTSKVEEYQGRISVPRPQIPQGYYDEHYRYWQPRMQGREGSTATEGSSTAPITASTSNPSYENIIVIDDDDDAEGRVAAPVNILESLQLSQRGPSSSRRPKQYKPKQKEGLDLAWFDRYTTDTQRRMIDRMMVLWLYNVCAPKSRERVNLRIRQQLSPRWVKMLLDPSTEEEMIQNIIDLTERRYKDPEYDAIFLRLRNKNFGICKARDEIKVAFKDGMRGYDAKELVDYILRKVTS